MTAAYLGAGGVAADPKRQATLQAQLALKGFTLVPTSDDRGRQVFIVSRWALTTQLDSLDAVEAFLRRIGGV